MTIAKYDAFSRRKMLITTIAGCAFMGGVPAFASERIAKSKKTGIAIKGYDTTAYWKHADARKGDQTFLVEHKGAKWAFASAAEADLFRESPESYTPQFGGFCTRALSMKIVVPADPEVWRMHGKKLYMFARPVGGTYFDKGPDEMIVKAQAFWDTLT